MSAPQVGDRVRVSFEATVYGPWNATLYPSSLHHFVGAGLTFALPHDIEVEVLPPPEPEWQERDVAVSDDGMPVRVHGHPANKEWQTFDGIVVDREEIRGRLTLILRDGKPVQS